MNRSLLLVALVVVGVAASSDARGQLTARDAPASAGAVQAVIGGTAPEQWKSATVGAEIEVVQSTTTDSRGIQVIRSNVGLKTKFARPMLKRVIVGSGAAWWDTDLAPGVSKVALVAPKTEVAEARTMASDGSPTVQYRPGRIVQGDTTFTVSPVPRALADWVKSAVATAGTSAATTLTKRDVTVTIRNQQGAALRTIALKRCLPTAYTSSGTTAVISLRPETTTITGQSPVFDWFAAMLEGRTGYARELKLTFLDSAGRVVSAPIMKNAFPTTLGWSTLDKASTEPVTEWLEVQPDTMDVMP